MGFEVSEGDPADEEARAIIDRSGRLIHNVAILELVVAAWLIELLPAGTAKAYLKKETWLDARVKRLITLLLADGAMGNKTLARRLGRIEPIRLFRNAVAHSPAGVDVEGKCALVGWRKTVPVSVQILAQHTTAAHEIYMAMFKAYERRFQKSVSLEMVDGAPPIG